MEQITVQRLVNSTVATAALCTCCCVIQQLCAYFCVCDFRSLRTRQIQHGNPSLCRSFLCVMEMWTETSRLVLKSFICYKTGVVWNLYIIKCQQCRLTVERWTEGIMFMHWLKVHQSHLILFFPCLVIKCYVITANPYKM